jgi:hypothetical protein
MNKIKNIIVINEPNEVLSCLKSQYTPWGVTTFYKDIRANILDRIPIHYKFNSDNGITDTNIITPEVYSQDFIFGTKSTLSYLNRIEELRLVFKNLSIIACIQNPYDTIASWKISLNYLCNIDLNLFSDAGITDNHINKNNSEFLNIIQSTKNLSIKRALFWKYLAKTILYKRDLLYLIKYEDLTLDTLKTLKSLILSMDKDFDFKFLEKINNSEVKSKRSILSTEDIDAIQNICFEEAYQLGYRL